MKEFSFPFVTVILVLISWSPAHAHENEVSITTDENYRYITANGIPEHATGQFPNRGNPNPISEQDYHFRVPLDPKQSGRVTALGHGDFGVAVNGVPFDPGTNEYWNNDHSSGWWYEALSGKINLGLDQNNAHVQPSGAYHYHGIPTGLTGNLSPTEHSKVVGWAADGFPIYAVYAYQDPKSAASGITLLHSSYRLKKGSRPSGPGGAYDGTFVQDYEYAQGAGDLDECNGRFAVTPEAPKGTYYYVLTKEFPFVPRCFMGTPDESFFKGLAHGTVGGSRSTGQGGSGAGREEGPSGGMNGGGPMGAGSGRGGRTPPPEAITACSGKTEGDACSFETPRGTLSGVCRVVPEGSKACVPLERGR